MASPAPIPNFLGDFNPVLFNSPCFLCNSPGSCLISGAAVAVFTLFRKLPSSVDGSLGFNTLLNDVPFSLGLPVVDSGFLFTSKFGSTLVDLLSPAGSGLFTSKVGSTFVELLFPAGSFLSTSFLSEIFCPGGARISLTTVFTAFNPVLI